MENSDLLKYYELPTDRRASLSRRFAVHYNGEELKEVQPTVLKTAGWCIIWRPCSLDLTPTMTGFWMPPKAGARILFSKTSCEPQRATPRPSGTILRAAFEYMLEQARSGIWSVLRQLALGFKDPPFWADRITVLKIFQRAFEKRRQQEEQIARPALFLGSSASSFVRACGENTLHKFCWA